MPTKFKYTGKAPKNFGRHELIQPGQIIECKDGKETSDLANSDEFEEFVPKAAKAPEEPKTTK